MKRIILIICAALVSGMFCGCHHTSKHYHNDARPQHHGGHRHPPKNPEVHHHHHKAQPKPQPKPQPQPRPQPPPPHRK